MNSPIAVPLSSPSRGSSCKPAPSPRALAAVPAPRPRFPVSRRRAGLGVAAGLSAGVILGAAFLVLGVARPLGRLVAETRGSAQLPVVVRPGGQP